MLLWKEKSMTRKVFQLNVWDEKKKKYECYLDKKINQSKFQIKKNSCQEIK